MIKKISILTATVLLVSSVAFAASDIDMGTSLLTSSATGKTLYGAKASASTASPLIGKTSTGVGLGVYSTSQGYAVTTMHMNGTKQYGTSYDATNIFTTDVKTKGTPVLGVPTAITSADFATWSSL